MAKEVFLYFLKLGTTGFGGPLATISIMQRELIQERQWMKKEDFLGTLSLIKAMPGPVSFQTSVFLGHRRAGWKGALLAAFGLILPSFLMMLALAYALPYLEGTEGFASWLQGFQIAALVVILSSLRSFLELHWRHFDFWICVLLGIVTSHFRPFLEPLIILSCGLILASPLLPRRTLTLLPLFADPLGPLFWTMLKAGALVFGTGLAIIPILEADVVQNHQWIRHSEFMTAVAFGQITPGPVVIAATLIGFQVAGFGGALLATLGIFLPSFIHMTTWFPRAVEWLRQQKWITDFTRGALGAVVGSLFAVVLRLGGSTSWDPPAYLTVLVLAPAIWLWRWPSWALIGGGGFTYALGRSLMVYLEGANAQ